ncbi:MAG: hypothetical protein JO303_08910 [Caulobacteraceae bacterium]|nr:hypothetical protein [Caulobacteraceae bacterium]
MAPAPARAQLAASAAIVSDDRFRGLSLSDGRPALSLDLAYDHPSGLYGGLSATATDTRCDGLRMLGYAAYVGYARRLDSRFTADVGVVERQIALYHEQRYAFDYAEAYAGLLTDHFSGHIHYSPRYFGQDAGVFYADLDGVLRLSRPWRLFAHAGVLTPVSGPGGYGARNERYDFKVGAAFAFDRLELQLSWTTALPQTGYFVQAGYPGYGASRSAVVLSASAFF